MEIPYQESARLCTTIQSRRRALTQGHAADTPDNRIILDPRQERQRGQVIAAARPAGPVVDTREITTRSSSTTVRPSCWRHLETERRETEKRSVSGRHPGAWSSFQDNWQTNNKDELLIFVHRRFFVKGSACTERAHTTPVLHRDSGKRHAQYSLIYRSFGFVLAGCGDDASVTPGGTTTRALRRRTLTVVSSSRTCFDGSAPVTSRHSRATQPTTSLPIPVSSRPPQLLERGDADYGSRGTATATLGTAGDSSNAPSWFRHQWHAHLYGQGRVAAGTAPPTCRWAAHRPQFQAGVLGINNPSLSSGGSTSLTAVLQQSDGQQYTQSTSINFNSPCLGQGLATITSPVVTTTGIAGATYAATGCSGTDVVTATATIGGATVSATALHGGARHHRLNLFVSATRPMSPCADGQYRQSGNFNGHLPRTRPGRWSARRQTVNFALNRPSAASRFRQLQLRVTRRVTSDSLVRAAPWPPPCVSRRPCKT